jgi:hypothetical protein
LRRPAKLRAERQLLDKVAAVRAAIQRFRELENRAQEVAELRKKLEVDMAYEAGREFASDLAEARPELQSVIKRDELTRISALGRQPTNAERVAVAMGLITKLS